VNHHCRFKCNIATTDHISCIHQVLKKKWEYNGTVNRLFLEFEMYYDPVRKELFYNIVFGFGIPVKLVRLIKM